MFGKISLVNIRLEECEISCLPNGAPRHPHQARRQRRTAQESSYFILQTSEFYTQRHALDPRGTQWLAGGTRQHRHASLVAKGGPLQHPDELRALLLGHEPGDAREHLGTVRLIHGHELLLHQLDALAVVDCL